MPAQITCPSCKKTIAVPGEKLGSTITCPSCGHSFAAAKPRAGSASPAPQPIKPSGEPPKPKADGVLEEISIDMTLHPSREPKTPEKKEAAVQTKTCPSCSAQMAANDIVCPKCNLNVMTGKRLERPVEAAESEAPEGAVVSGKMVGLIIAAIVLAIAAFWFHFLRRGGEEQAVETPKKPVNEETPKGPTKEELAARRKKEEEGRAERVRIARQKNSREAAEESIKQAGSREGQRKWGEALALYKEAIERYGKSDQPEKAEEVKKNVAGVEEVVKALKLHEEEKWDDAVAAYKKAQENLVNKAFVDSQLEFIGKYRQFAERRKQAETHLYNGKWEEAKAEFEKAFEIADKLALKEEKTNVRNRATQVDDIRAEWEARHADMLWMFEQMDKEKSPHGLYAATFYYTKSDNHRLYAEEAKAKMEEAKKQLASEKALRAEGPEKRTVLTMKEGPKLQGRLIEEDKGNIKFEVIEGGKSKPQTIVGSTVEKREEIELTAEQVNAERAQPLFVDVVTECEKKDWYKALEKIGVLLNQFGDVPLVTDAAKQEEIAKKAARDVTAGTTLEAMLATAVAFCEAICPKCKGAKKVRCPFCDQDGKILVICSYCSKRVFCPQCGTDQIVRTEAIDDKVTCEKCKKPFAGLDVKCPFCGQIFLRKIALENEEIVCPHCEKRGQGKKFMPTEKMPVAIGKILCPYCMGTGKAKKGRCLRCNGRRLLRCEQCAKEHKGMMWTRCPNCRPPDFMTKCPACGGRGVRPSKGTKIEH